MALAARAQSRASAAEPSVDRGWACLCTSAVTLGTCLWLKNFHSIFQACFFYIFPCLAFSFHIKTNPSLLLTLYAFTCKALGLDYSSQRRALEGKNKETKCINMIAVLHRGSTLSFKTTHSVNEKQGIPTPCAQSSFYFIHSEELRHETFSITSHKSCLWL